MTDRATSSLRITRIVDSKNIPREVGRAADGTGVRLDFLIIQYSCRLEVERFFELATLMRGHGVLFSFYLIKVMMSLMDKGSKNGVGFYCAFMRCYISVPFLPAR